MPAADAVNSTFAPSVQAFFHLETGTFSYVVHAPGRSAGVIVDPVLDFDSASGRTTSTRSADAIVDCVRVSRLDVRWILETHAHADHLSAAHDLRQRLGAPIAIGRGIVPIQVRFGEMFGLGDDFVPDGRQFDRLLDDGDTLEAGQLDVRVAATPGHTEDSLTYLIGDSAFVGDTLFAPDVGTARCDFPGGDAATLYRSIQRILDLPAQTRVFLCHDYPPGQQRPPMPQTTVAAQRAANVHVGGAIPEAAFVEMRTARDAKLAPPRLMMPALRANIRCGKHE